MDKRIHFRHSYPHEITSNLVPLQSPTTLHLLGFPTPLPHPHRYHTRDRDNFFLTRHTSVGGWPSWSTPHL
jgi:hypothetical protein